MDNSKPECCIDANAIISILFGADVINKIDPDFWMTSDLYCIYVFIKPFIMMFLYEIFFSFIMSKNCQNSGYLWILFGLVEYLFLAKRH